MSTEFPGTDWTRDTTLVGDEQATLEAAVARAGRRGSPAVMVVAGGRLVASHGDLAARIDMASARKSLLSALYGIYVDEGVIDLSWTLGELDVDERDPLTESEKRATLRDLLMARSGVYRPAAAEGLPMKLKRPRRGSHGPGEHWYYNNFDFNVLGTVFEQLVGASVHEAFERRIAGPIGMQDYTAADGFYRTTTRALQPAYRFALSTRDMARFGLLCAHDGRWRDQQVVPAAWIRESTLAHTPRAKGSFGYGYSWWIGRPEELSGHAFFLARGGDGHAIVVVPDLDLVVVHRVRPNRLARRLHISWLVGRLTRLRVGPHPRRHLPPTTLSAILDAAVPALRAHTGRGSSPVAGAQVGS